MIFDRTRKLFELSRKARRIQKQLKETEIEAVSADGAVKVIFTGEQRLKSVEIAQGELRAENKRELERKLTQTIAEAISRAQHIAAQKAKEITGDLNIPGLT